MQYRRSPEIEEVAHELIEDHHKMLRNYGPRIVYVMTKPPKNPETGKDYAIRKVTGVNAFLAQSRLPEEFGWDAGELAAIEVKEQYWQRLKAAQQEGLVDHLLCFPAGTSVTGPKVDASSLRWYSGELTRIRTAAGNLLSGTPNHPILTGRGWVALGSLQEGDYVVSSSDPERVSAGMDPDEYQPPALIEDVARSLLRLDGMMPGLMPQPAHDLHGHIAEREIDVVPADGGLQTRRVTSGAEHFGHVAFDGGNVGLVALPGPGDLDPGSLALRYPTTSRLRLPDPAISFDSKHDMPVSLRIAERPDLDAGGDKLFFDGSRVAAELLKERIDGSSGGVAFDKVIDIVSGPWAGHVYNLRTSQGWYVANNIITHNCHLTYDLEKDSWTIEAPEFGEFPEVLERHGFWKPGTRMKSFAAVVSEQLSLLDDQDPEEANEAGEDEEDENSLQDSFERLRPGPDSGIESVTISSGGRSATLEART